MKERYFPVDLLDQSVIEDAVVPFRDLRVLDFELKQELLREIDDVLSEGPILMGPRVTKFERQMAEYCGRRYCVGVSSGTDALYLSLLVLDIQPSDQIITTPMSWIATLNAVNLVGATPIFVDIDYDQNINPDRIEEAITSKTRAILPVHFTGRLCNMEKIDRIAKEHNLLVIEDAAQSMGARTAGFRSGSVGHVAAFSFNPMKVFPGYGEAGAIVTDDTQFERRLRMLRYLGTRGKEVCVEPSLNYKMDEIQAAMLLTGFGRIDSIVEKRNSLARQYSLNLSNIVRCPPVAREENYVSNYYDYVIVCENRDGLRQYLKSRGIETKVKHPLLLPDHPAYKESGAMDIPIATELVKKIISLPLHEKMTNEDVDYVCSCINEFYHDC